MTRDERIRVVYRKRRRFTRPYAARVLGKSVAWVEKNRFEPERGGFLAWEEVVLLAQYLWTHRQVEAALGPHAAKIFPPMARLARLTVRLPRHTIVALRYTARRRHLDVSEIVNDELSSLVLEPAAEEIDAMVPGFLDGWDFPYTMERRAEIRAEVDAARRVRAEALFDFGDE